MGDILVADRAYLDLEFLCALALRGVFFTVRQKTNLHLDVAGKFQEPCVPDVARHTTQILADEKVRPATAASAAKYTADGGCLRRAGADEALLANLRDGLHGDAHADAENFAKVAHRRENVPRPVVARLNGRAKACGNLPREIAVACAVEREGRCPVRGLVPHKRQEVYNK